MLKRMESLAEVLKAEQKVKMEAKGYCVSS